MKLKFPDDWRFEWSGEAIPIAAVREFHSLLLRIANSAEKRRYVLESFKTEFGRAGYSSSESWAESDLYDAMTDEAANAALFVDQLWSCIQLVGDELATPSTAKVNKMLAEHHIPLLIDPPNLRMRQVDAAIVESVTGVSGERSADQFIRCEEIGRGGYGIVYRVLKTTSVSEFEYAMKVLEPSSFDPKPERALQRFEREIQSLKRLQHRAIVPCLEAGVDHDGKPYILMPLIKGARLRDAASGRPLAFIVNLFEEILGALVFAHANDVIHRDLKPSNVMVRESDDQAIVLDFGCSYALDNADESSLTTAHIGTLGYIPREVISNPKFRTPLHDVYACGVMLYEVIGEGRPDFDDYSPLSRDDRSLKPIDELVLAATAAKNKRISAGEFLRRLRAISKKI